MKTPEKVHVHVKIDADVWRKTEKVIKEMGFSRSGFVEMMLKRFIQAETAHLGDLIEDILKDVLGAKMGKKLGKK